MKVDFCWNRIELTGYTAQERLELRDFPESEKVTRSDYADHTVLVFWRKPPIPCTMTKVSE